VDANGATVDITTSLSEDGADHDRAVLCCSPEYVGWGSHETVFVDLSASGPGDGTPEQPYNDLQAALAGFDLHLGANSPCIGAASDGGNLGAGTGIGDVSGNVTAELHLAPGTYDIRGRNVIFVKGIQGAGSAQSSITNTVFGWVEDATIKDLAIQGEEIFGGVVVRANIEFEGCDISENAALVDGGGIYVAEGYCGLTETSVSENVCYDGQGGGIGAAIVRRLRDVSGNYEEIYALGTNPIATSQMMKAGANRGATGENAIVRTSQDVNVIIGPIAIVMANAMMGELTPKMAEAISSSRALKVLIPLTQENTHIVGLSAEPLPHLVEKAIQIIKEI